MKDYQEFMSGSTNSADDSTPGVKVPEEILRSLRGRLFPNPWSVFAKVAAIHGIVGFLSLGICNQFGLNPFQRSTSLADFFMRTGGHHFCMFACGVFFVAGTYLLANFFLTLEEFESVRRYEWLQTGVLSLISVAGFYFGGAELLGSLVSLWLVGAFVGGVLSVEGSYRLRLRRI
jgi:hypothetical protein